MLYLRNPHPGASSLNFSATQRCERPCGGSRYSSGTHSEKVDLLRGKLECTYHVQAAGKPTRQVKDQRAQGFQYGVDAHSGNHLLQDIILIKDHCVS